MKLEAINSSNQAEHSMALNPGTFNGGSNLRHRVSQTFSKNQMTETPKGSINRVLEAIRASNSDDHTFWKGLSKEKIQNKYPVLRAEKIQHITPVWDYDSHSACRNELSDDILKDLILYIGRRQSFLEACSYPSDYTQTDLTKRSTDRKILRIISLWEGGVPLPPPVFGYCNDRLIKQDGHHRVLVAIASGASKIPFFCRSELRIDGVRKYENQREQGSSHNVGKRSPLS